MWCCPRCSHSRRPRADEFSPEREARNYSKINERAAEYSTPEYQAELRRRSVENRLETTRIRAEDPERNFDATLCGTRNDGCAGDVRLYDWEVRGHKGDPTADSRLITDRWRADAPEAAVDPDRDGNQFSFYYPSRLDLHLSSGARFRCENLRSGCALPRDLRADPVLLPRVGVES